MLPAGQAYRTRGLPQWLAAEGLTMGLATPVVVAHVATLVATWAHRIQHLLRALLASLRRLWTKLDDLTAVFTTSGTHADGLARSDFRTSTAGEFRPDFPRGADFVDDGGGFTAAAADAYRRIRHSPGDTPRVAGNTGIDSRVIEGMRQNLFVQQHDISLGPGHVERGYFTPDERTAHL